MTRSSSSARYHSRRPRQRAWTFVEMLIAISMSAILLGTATLVFQSITANSKRLSQLIDVTFSTNKVLEDFYGQKGETEIRVYSAPNYGKSATAQTFRDLMLEDAMLSSGVYCLHRAGSNTIHPGELDYILETKELSDGRKILDNSETFRKFLAKSLSGPTQPNIFAAQQRHIPLSTHRNTSIFMLAPHSDDDKVQVRAVYDIDFVDAESPNGVYASVRRYQEGTLTHYYDIFYPIEDGDTGTFAPSFVSFEREGLLALNEGDPIDRFKIAKSSPFYFVWLPDPAINPYKVKASTSAPTDPAISPRQAYGSMSKKTSISVVLPMFPST